MLTLVAITLIVLFSAVIGSTLAWVIARTLLDVMDHTTQRLPVAARMPAPSLVRVPSRVE